MYGISRTDFYGWLSQTQGHLEDFLANSLVVFVIFHCAIIVAKLAYNCFGRKRTSIVTECIFVLFDVLLYIVVTSFRALGLQLGVVAFAKEDVIAFQLVYANILVLVSELAIRSGFRVSRNHRRSLHRT